MNESIKKSLEALALNRTNPFCPSCERVVDGDRCPVCFSDDLMRFMPGVGVEWGLDWAISEIIVSELTPVDLDSEFEESIRESYPETTSVGFMTFDTVDVMKSMDPIAWSLARDEYVDQLSQDEEIMSFDHGATYYRMSDILHLIE